MLLNVPHSTIEHVHPHAGELLTRSVLTSRSPPDPRDPRHHWFSCFRIRQHVTARIYTSRNFWADYYYGSTVLPLQRIAYDLRVPLISTPLERRVGGLTTLTTGLLPNLMLVYGKLSGTGITLRTEGTRASTCS